MKTTLVALSCALVSVIACSDNRPARDPYGATNTTSAGDGDGSTRTSTTTGSSPATAHATHATPATTETTTPATSGTNGAAPTGNSGTDQAFAGASTGGTATGVKVNDNPGSADQTNRATNTGVNDRDRHGTATPGDQGNGKDELRITAAIRKALVGSKSLSFNAKNAKVVTVGTKVTLRGAVKSDAEKAEIESLAKATAGVTEVDDQLEVKK